MKYLMDYENTNDNGLNGIENLSEEDSLEIFYSDKAQNISIDLIPQLMQSKCKFMFSKLNKTAPNYLDFHIATKVGFLLHDEDNVAIISKDKGYISVRDYWNTQGKNVILLEDLVSCESLSKKLTNVTNTSNVKGKVSCDVNTSEEGKGKELNVVTKAVEKAVVSAISETEGLKTINNVKKKPNPPVKKRVLSPELKEEIKQITKDLPKKNGATHQSLYTGYVTCKTEGELRFLLINDLQREVGEKAFALVKEHFNEYNRMNPIR